MRTLSVGLAAHIVGDSTTRCNMLLVSCSDGASYGFTDHDDDLSYDLTEAALGSISYSASLGMILSDVSLSAGLDTDNFEVKVPIDETITLAALLGGRFNRAIVWLFQINWDDLSQGKAAIFKGNVSEVRIESGLAVFQIRSIIDRFNQSIGRLITPYCDADFGDARCGVTPESITGTVTAVTDAMHFTVSFAGSFADDHFNQGTVQAGTGILAGTKPIEIWDWTSAGVITLFASLAEAPEIGDEFLITRGCSKLRKSDDASIPTCMSYSNIVNFRGFPEVPGSDQVLKIAVPGNAGA